jgi:hypothetical protein
VDSWHLFDDGRERQHVQDGTASPCDVKRRKRTPTGTRIRTLGDAIAQFVPDTGRRP